MKAEVATTAVVASSAVVVVAAALAVVKIWAQWPCYCWQLRKLRPDQATMAEVCPYAQQLSERVCKFVFAVERDCREAARWFVGEASYLLAFRTTEASKASPKPCT